MLLEVPLARMGAVASIAMLVPGVFAAFDGTTVVPSGLAVPGLLLGLACTWLLAGIFTPDAPVEPEARGYVLRSVGLAVGFGVVLAVEAAAHVVAATSLPVRVAGGVVAVLLLGVVGRSVVRTRVAFSAPSA